MTDLNWTLVRDQIKTILEDDVGILLVHPFPRVDPQNNVERWRNLMETDSRLNAWTILRTSAPASFYSTCEMRIEHQVTIRGLLQLSDEGSSQDEFDNTIDAIMIALFPNLSLTNTATIQGPASLAVEDIRLYANTIIHFAEIITVVNQTVQVTGKS